MWRFVCTAVLAAMSAPALPVLAQTITVDVDLVNIYFTVCDRKGRLIPNLDRESFAVFEDGEPQFITNFSREADVPLRIVMLIDTSGSVWDKLSYEREAATEFLYAALEPGRDEAAVLTFDSTIESRQDFTRDQSLLAAAVGRLYAGGGTRLYDALYFVMQEKLSGFGERKAIVLITDGEDRSSRRSPQDVVELAHRSNVSIYAISMNRLGFGYRWPAQDRSDAILKILASETGGRAFFPAKVKHLASSFKTIAGELRSQYTIAYRSTNSSYDGSFRRVRIEVKKSRYRVQARPGYYAPAQR